MRHILLGPVVNYHSSNFHFSTLLYFYPKFCDRLQAIWVNILISWLTMAQSMHSSEGYSCILKPTDWQSLHKKIYLIRPTVSVWWIIDPHVNFTQYQYWGFWSRDSWRKIDKLDNLIRWSTVLYYDDWDIQFIKWNFDDSIKTLTNNIIDLKCHYVFCCFSK